MLTGTLYYANALNIGYAKGFYMAVNVGYSIGWGYPIENSIDSRVFSIFYVLVGASAVAASLGYFAQTMINSSKDWYAQALQQEKYTNATSIEKYLHWMSINSGSLNVIGVWFLWIFCMVAFSLSEIKWDFSQAVYFAVSSFSTGGLWAIPSDSPDWYFGLGTIQFEKKCFALYDSFV
jgi:hypothetical protein